MEMPNTRSDASSPLDRRLLLGAAGLAGIAALASGRAKAGGGPLNPPAGAVGSTGKTIAEAEPRTAINATNTPGDADSVFRITQAGGYYLTGNLLVTSGKNGIEVAASGVTIDLNGFQITFFGGLKGIVASSTSLERITIRNGRIIGGSAGLDLAGVADVTVESVAAETSSGPGIRTGDRAAVINCSAVGNTSFGITVGAGSRIESCAAASNTGVGFTAAAGSVVTGCASLGNSGNGFSLTGCTVFNCTARENSTGIFLSSSAATACVSSDNGGSGFVLGDHSTVTDSVADGNTNSGITASGESTVRRNTCSRNAFGSTVGAGVFINSGGNFIEGNRCVGNNRGIRVVSSGNTLIGNTVRLSTLDNWEVSSGNACLVVAAATGASFTGDSGGASIGSTNPYANFTL